MRPKLVSWLQEAFETAACQACHGPLEPGLLRRLHAYERGLLAMRDDGPLASRLCPSCAGQLPYHLRPLRVAVMQGEQRAMWARFAYAGKIKEMSLRLKFAGERALAALLSLFLVELLAELPQQPTHLLPMPLAKRRLRERGYNQAEALAQGMAQATGLPVETGLLRRHKETRRQSELPGRTARLANVQGAFSLRPEALQRLPKQAKIVLLDDVATSGASMAMAAASLEAEGFHPLCMVLASDLPAERASFTSPGKYGIVKTPEGQSTSFLNLQDS